MVVTLFFACLPNVNRAVVYLIEAPSCTHSDMAFSPTFLTKISLLSVCFYTLLKLLKPCENHHIATRILQPLSKIHSPSLY